MIIRRIALALSVCAVLASPAVAQPPRPAMTWQVDWGDQFCTLVRNPSDPSALIVAARTVPGSRSAALRILHRRGGGLPDRTNNVVLLPSGQSFEVGGDPEVLQNGQRVLGLYPLPRSFWDALAGASELQLRRGDQVLDRFALTNTAAAVRALRQCASDAMREWGIDEAALGRIRQLPQPLNHYGLDSVDYPQAAMRERVGGRMLIRVAVSVDGRATECRTVATSGDVLLDRAACPTILRFGRFTPAIDVDGQNVGATYVATIRWVP